MSNLVPLIIRRCVPIQTQQIRYLPRWSHRTPARVIPADEYDETRDIQVRKPVSKFQQPNVKINWEKSRTSALKSDVEQNSEPFLQTKIKTNKTVTPLSISKPTKAKQETVDMLQAIIDSDGNFIYTKMKNNDSRVGSILTEVKSKKEKQKKDLILLEGKRLIRDALECGCKLEYILFSRMDEVEYLRPFLPKLGAHLYKMPYKEMQMWSDLTTTPGIMGIFKIPDTETYQSPTDSIPLTIICDNIREPNNLGAILRTCSAVGCENVFLTKGCVNVWETKVLRCAAGAHFRLRISKKLTWDDIKEKLPPDPTIYIADNKTINTSSNEDTDIHNLETKIQSVPVLPYYGVNFRNQHVVLIVGGETEGLSSESYELASELKGARLNVPLSNGVDSLNTGTALGIIAFEVKRQLLKNEDVENDYLSSKC